MTHRLHLKFEQLDRATARLLAAAEALGPDATRQPAPGAWSAAQVVHHLLFIEGRMLKAIQSKLQDPDQLLNPSLVTRLRALLVRGLLRLPGLRVTAPPGVATRTDANEIPPLAQMQADWQALRRQWEQLLNEYPGPLLGRAIFPHPRAGMLNIYQSMEFLVDHLLHHQQQMTRIKAALRAA